MYLIKSILYNNRFRFSRIRNRLIMHSQKQLQNIHSKKNQNQKKDQFLVHKKNIFTMSLIGSPNSGKSTLFNTIVGERLALTDSIPGMTRDRKQITIWNGLLKVIDTPGIQKFNLQMKKQEISQSKEMKLQILKQTLTAYKQSDLILYVIDGKMGITKQQIQFVKFLRRFGNIDKVNLVVNKCENIDQIQLVNQVYQLGLKQIFYVSGEFGDGVLEMLQQIDKKIPQELKSEIRDKKQKRKIKFNNILKKLREEIKLMNENDKNFDIKSWQREFIKLNKNPQENSQLDEEQINVDQFTKPQQTFSTKRGTSEANIMLKNTIQICIIGRPNVGKTSLVNQILGQDKLVVSQIKHTTRDSSINQWTYKNRRIQLIDTAGLSTTNFDNNPQHLKKVQISTMNHVKFAHVVVYLLDADSAMKNIDFTFIKRIIKQGRPIIITINKWQIIKPQYKKKAMAYIKNQIDTHLGQLNGPSIVYISVKINEGIDKLMDEILNVYQKWNRRVSTGMLNNWLQKFKKLQNLPIDGLQRLKIRFVVQAKVRPPCFIMFVNNKQLFKDNYLRFMRTNLVQQFKLQGIPIRILLRNCETDAKSKQQLMTQKQKNYKKWKQHFKKQKRRLKLNEYKLKYGNFGKKN